MGLWRRGDWRQPTHEKREQMRAVSRLGRLLLGGALAIAPAAALAQEAPPSSDTPAADSVGPRELQNFSLNGTVTHAADQPAPVQVAPPTRKPRAQAQAAPAATAPAPASQASNAAPAPTPRRTETASAVVPPPAQPQRAPE